MAIKVFRSITLSAKRNSWRMLDSHADESDRRYYEVRSQVLERDDKTCGYCGFRAEKYQEVHHLDDNHGNNKLSNLLTTCSLCHQCFHLGLAGVRRSGIIIWAPEIEQAALNNLVRAIFVAVTNGGQHVESARSLYTALESRAAIVEQELGPGASNPSSVGQAFLDMTPEQYETRGERLGGLRLLAKLQSFGAQVAFWKSDPSAFGSLVDGDWSHVMPEEMERITRDGPSPLMEDHDSETPPSRGNFDANNRYAKHDAEHDTEHDAEHNVEHESDRDNYDDRDRE
jgi:intracellular multiplication protein IcmJ